MTDWQRRAEDAEAACAVMRGALDKTVTYLVGRESDEHEAVTLGIAALEATAPIEATQTMVAENMRTDGRGPGVPPWAQKHA